MKMIKRLASYLDKQTIIKTQKSSGLEIWKSWKLLILLSMLVESMIMKGWFLS